MGFVYGLFGMKWFIEKSRVDWDAPMNPWGEGGIALHLSLAVQGCSFNLISVLLPAKMVRRNLENRSRETNIFQGHAAEPLVLGLQPARARWDSPGS